MIGIRSVVDPDQAARAPVLAVMAREPVPGRVKTRLTPPLSEEGAARLYEAFLVDVLESCLGLRGLSVCCLVHPPGGRQRVQGLVGGRLAVEGQRGADLAARMVAAVEDLGGSGARPVLLRNSDSPTLPGHLVEEAARVLGAGEADAVFGPDQGGGYYLVGLARPCPDLFRQVPMSTDGMYAQTLALARTRGLRVHELPMWLDVDQPGDLLALARELQASTAAGNCPRTRAIVQELAHAQRTGRNHGLLQAGATLPPLPDVT